MKENDHLDYKNVYSNLIKNVDEVLNDISKIDIKHIDVKKKNDETQSKLKELRNGFVRDVDKLDKNAIWDRYTIAFFGETNAGKSTIIESLRISLGEDEKLKNNILKKSLDLRISELSKNSEEIIATKNETKKYQIENITSKLESTKERALRLEKAFWSKWLNVFRSWFGLLPFLFLRKKIIFLEHKIFEINSKIPEQDIDVQKLFKEISHLKEFREGLFDGEIIGTGIPDFTQSCVEYYFNQQEKPFTLIDVPGIEGKESEYETIIMDAVSKAHCVFYVCSTNKLPEIGTVDKIKKYLKEQTEVYFLLNERNKPSSFDEVLTFEAICPNADKFRTEITNQMKNVLGDFYKGCYSLQGLMAFYSKAGIHEEERNFKSQKKILEKFETREKLYSFSQLEKVETLIRIQLNGMEGKIINANVQKAICAMIDFKNHIEEIRNTEYSNEFILDIEKEIKIVKEKNDNEFRQCKDGFNQLSNSLANSSVEHLRKRLYHLVENKENNAQLNNSDEKSLQSPFYSDQEKKIKFIAECYTNYVYDELSIKYEYSAEKVVKSFAKGVKENAIKMQSNIEQIALFKFSSDLNNSISLSFDISFSFDWVKLEDSLISIGGLAMAGMSFGPWGVAIGAAIGVVFNIIRFFIGGESPESKAKKQVDEKLSNLKTEIKNILDVSNTIIIDDCKKNVIDKVKNILEDNINGIKAVQIILDTKTCQLEKVIEEIKKTKN